MLEWVQWDGVLSDGGTVGQHGVVVGIRIQGQHCWWHPLVDDGSAGTCPQLKRIVERLLCMCRWKTRGGVLKRQREKD